MQAKHHSHTYNNKTEGKKKKHFHPCEENGAKGREMWLGAVGLTSSTFILMGLMLPFSVPTVTPSAPHSSSLSQHQHTPSTHPITSGGQVNCSDYTMSTHHQTPSGAMSWALPTANPEAGWSQHIPG